MTEPSLPDEILDHYANRKDEDARLRGGQGRLEFARVQEIVRCNLPEGPQRILDVGGATGVHAEWLLADGHQVHLIDPVPSHVARATESLGANPAFSATVRDVVGVEGLAGWLGHLGPRWDDAADREAVLRAARATEHEPTLMGLSAHLVTVARKGA